jgi:NADH-quinone oxidoreductase subunit G
MTDTVNITIDGRAVQVQKGTLLVEAAKRVGIDIPVFCYHEKLKPVGACRMCLVEIEKMPRLQTACTTPVGEGMVVRTQAGNVKTAQNGVLELLLANHPLDCPICDKGGECPLQDTTFQYGLGESRMTEPKRALDKAFPLSDRIALDKERCIMCMRCTRFQAEVVGDEAITVMERGGQSEIGCLPGKSFDSPFSGNTVELCPVGALTSRQYRFRARPWDLKVRVPAVCNGCAVGCNVELHARDGRILRMWGRENLAVNDLWLCDRGRFDTLPSLATERPRQAQLRSDGALKPAEYATALSGVAERLRAAGKRAAVLLGPTLSNEALFVAGSALRRALPDATLALWPNAATAWPVEGSLTNVTHATRILLVGLDLWSELPVAALRVRKATQAGAALVVVGDHNGLARDTALWWRAGSAELSARLRELLAALQSADPVGARQGDAGEISAEARRAASLLQAAGPAVVLASPELAADTQARDTLRAIAAQLGASAETGMLGAPALGANGRGALDLVPELVAQALPADLDAAFDSVLCVGGGGWPALGAGKLLLASYEPLAAGLQPTVLLPLAHGYEQAGSITNFAGVVQPFQAGGFSNPALPADFALLGKLAAALGAEGPLELAGVRAALCARHPAYAAVLARPAKGRPLPVLHGGAE